VVSTQYLLKYKEKEIESRKIYKTMEKGERDEKC